MVAFGDIGLLWWLLAAFGFFVLVSHVAWWSKKAYFPNQDFCAAFHRRVHLSKTDQKEKTEEEQAEMEKRFWHRMGISLISAVPPELEISGFFAALFWPLVVLLNLFLLAQVLPVAVGEGSGGGVIELHPFGIYGAIPLLAALLYSFTQTAFGIICGEARDKKKKYLFFLLLTTSVLAEGGLSVYRAWLIQGGGDKLGL
jgi:hypothetical protein